MSNVCAITIGCSTNWIVPAMCDELYILSVACHTAVALNNTIAETDSIHLFRVAARPEK